jgi:hypothetical protein
MKVLTVELNAKENRVEINFDDDGLKILKRSLDSLQKAGTGHDHLMTPSWAGAELTETKQSNDTQLIHHLVFVHR